MNGSARVALIGCLALLTALGICVGARANADESDALRLPSGWTLQANGPQTFARWVARNASYDGMILGGYAGSTDALMHTLDAPHPIPLTPGVEERRVRIERCGIVAALTTLTVRYRSPRYRSLPPNVSETLDFVADGAWYSIVYHNGTAPANDPIDRLLRTTCPADLAFASPPPGWRTLPASRTVRWMSPDGVNGPTVMLAAQHASGGELSTRDLPPGFTPAFSGLVTSCGLPLLIAQGTIDLDGSPAAADLAISRSGTRDYLAAYVHGSDESDAAVRAALLSLCAKAALPAAPFAAIAHLGPRTIAVVRAPAAFRARQTITYSATGAALPETTETEQFAAGDRIESTTKIAYGGNVETRSDALEGRWYYERVNGVWYKHDAYRARIPYLYPNYQIFHGATIRGTDTAIDGAPSEVYYLLDGTSDTTLWVDKRTRYLRRVDAHAIAPPPFSGWSDSSTRFDRFDRPVPMNVPDHARDVTSCATGIVPPAPLTAVQPDTPPDAPPLTASVMVELLVSVNGEGRLIDAVVTKSSGSSSLDRAALEATRKTTFSAGSIYCAPGTTQGLYDVEFDAQ